MTDEKTCYNCGNKNCNVYYSIVKKDYKRHFEIYEYQDFDCVNHDKWEELKVEETLTDKMTDEKKLAERYVNGIPIFAEEGEGFSRTQMQKAYLAGLKAGRLKWHFVKDRLPKELHDVLCFVIHNEHRFVLQGYLRDGRWVLSPLGTYLNNDDVIAWCEIELPKESE